LGRILVLLLSLGVLFSFQNCSSDLDLAKESVSEKSIHPDPPTAQLPFQSIGPAFLLADKQRTPLGQSYHGGVALIQAGEKLFSFREDAFSPVQIQPNHYRQGSTHLTLQLDSGEMLAIDMTVRDGKYIHFDHASSNWKGRYLKFKSPFGEQSDQGAFEIDRLPGDSIGHFEPFSLFQTENYIYLSLYRSYREESPWVVDGVEQMVPAGYADSWLVRSSKSDPFRFQLMGPIGVRRDYERALQEGGLAEFKLPLYHAAGPRCIAESDLVVVCALRGSADDDDGYRPLDPGWVFNEVSNFFLEGFLSGGGIVRGIYSPEVSSEKYYEPRNNLPIPPLLIAKTTDGGLTWSHKVIAERGGVDSHFSYDPNSNRLVIAYGGLTYPRRGIAIQWSTDFGDSWSEQKVVTDERDFYTTGTVFLTHSKSNDFLLVYDSLKNYIEYDYSLCGTQDLSCRPTAIKDNHRILYRKLSF